MEYQEKIAEKNVKMIDLQNTKKKLTEALMQLQSRNSISKQEIQELVKEKVK